MKKIITILSAIAITICMLNPLTVCASSEDNQNMISIQEYIDIVNRECEKAGISIQVESEEEMVSTDALTRVLYAINAVANTQVEVNEYHAHFAQETIGNNRGVTGMPIAGSGVTNLRVTNLLGWADIAVEAYVTIDAQNAHILSINSTSTHISAGQNISGWNGNILGQSMNSPADGYVTLNVVGYATFTYTDPVFEITNTLTTNVNSNVAVDCR